MLTFRRVETGHDDGRAVIRSDGAPLHTVHAPNGVAVSELLWLDGPVRSVDDGRDRTEAGFPLEPPPGGASFRILSLPPPQPGVDIDATWLRVPGDDDARPGMHASDTLDYVVIIDGEIVLGLDDGDHQLGTGDVVIQRGTAHRWRVVGDRPCTYGVLMLRPDAQSSSVNASLQPRASASGTSGGTKARMRRLVTATDADGKSFVESFGVPPVVLEPSGPAGVSLIDFWQSGGRLTSVEQGGDADSWELDPVGDGICCRSPQLPAGMDVGDRGWHATNTIDLNLARAAFDRSGQPDEDELDPWGCLSAAVLCPSVAAALAETVGPADREVLVRLGERLAEPAASWCNELADSLSQVA